VDDRYKLAILVRAADHHPQHGAADVAPSEYVRWAHPPAPTRSARRRRWREAETSLVATK